MAEIFVFGSNTHGIHGAGAARTAYKEHGARWGMGYGHYGNSFAIPTKLATKEGVGDTLLLSEIEDYVLGFLAYAKHHPELTFNVTRIGCGLAGLSDRDVASMFRRASRELPNVQFDLIWAEHLCANAKFWGTF